MVNYFSEIHLVPGKRTVFIDHRANYNIDDLVSAELLKERRWDSLGITTRSEGETAIKSAEMACIKVINFKDLTLNCIRSIHEEYSLNWNRGINYP